MLKKQPSKLADVDYQKFRFIYRNLRHRNYSDVNVSWVVDLTPEKSVSAPENPLEIIDFTDLWGLSLHTPPPTSLRRRGEDENRREGEEQERIRRRGLGGT